MLWGYRTTSCPRDLGTLRWQAQGGFLRVGERQYHSAHGQLRAIVASSPVGASPTPQEHIPLLESAQCTMCFCSRAFGEMGAGQLVVLAFHDNIKGGP